MINQHSREPHIIERVNQFAHMMAHGERPADIGRAMGLTKGETSACLRRIKQDLGEQAR